MELKEENRIVNTGKLKEQMITGIMQLKDSKIRDGLLYRLAEVEAIVGKCIVEKGISIIEFLKIDPMKIFYPEGFNSVEKNCTIITWYTTILMEIADRLSLTDDILLQHDIIISMLEKDPRKFHFFVNSEFNGANIFTCESFVILYKIWNFYCNECRKRRKSDTDFTQDCFPISFAFMWDALVLLGDKIDQDIFIQPIIELKEYCKKKAQKQTK